MEIQETFLYFKTISAFNQAKQNIKKTSIAFIEETQQIYTHDVFYSLTQEELQTLINNSILNYVNDKVVGPAQSVSGNIPVFNGTTGKIISDSGFTIASSVPSDAKFTDTTYEVATQEQAGLMSAEDKVKLDELLNEDYIEQLLTSNRFSAFIVENITINGETYLAGTTVDVLVPDVENFILEPTSDSSIYALYAYPGALSWRSWMEGVQIFSGIIFDMNDINTYIKWSQYNQGEYHVQYAQYSNCIFWSDNPFILSPLEQRTNYTLYNSNEMPLCYSTIPDNTFKSFYCAYGVTNDPNWANSLYRNSFAIQTAATQVFSYYGMQTIGVYNMDSPYFNITLPTDCRGLMFYATAIENAGVFDAALTTTFGAKSGSWRDAFANCYALTNLFIKNLKTSINLSWSPINSDSLDFMLTEAANTSKITIYLSPYTYHRLSDAQKQLAQSKNITLELISTNIQNDPRLGILTVIGDGTKYLTNDGTYKDIEEYTLPIASSTLGGVKTTSTVTDNTDLTACPIIDGVPYYQEGWQWLEL